MVGIWRFQIILFFGDIFNNIYSAPFADAVLVLNWVSCYRTQVRLQKQGHNAPLLICVVFVRISARCPLCFSFLCTVLTPLCLFIMSLFSVSSQMTASLNIKNIKRPFFTRRVIYSPPVLYSCTRQKNIICANSSVADCSIYTLSGFWGSSTQFK